MVSISMSDHINIGFVWDRPTLSNMIIMFLHSSNKSVVNVAKELSLQINNIASRYVIRTGPWSSMLLHFVWIILKIFLPSIWKKNGIPAPKRRARHRISKPLDDGQNGGNSCQYDNGLLNMIQSSQKIQYWLIDRFKLFFEFSEIRGFLVIMWISNYRVCQLK